MNQAQTLKTKDTVVLVILSWLLSMINIAHTLLRPHLQFMRHPVTKKHLVVNGELHMGPFKVTLKMKERRNWN